MRIALSVVFVLVTGFAWSTIDFDPPNHDATDQVVHTRRLTPIEESIVWVWNDEARGFDCVPGGPAARAAGVCDDYPLPLSPASLHDYTSATAHGSP